MYVPPSPPVGFDTVFIPISISNSTTNAIEDDTQSRSAADLAYYVKAMGMYVRTMAMLWPYTHTGHT